MLISCYYCGVLRRYDQFVHFLVLTFEKIMRECARTDPARETTNRAESASIMPASRDGDVQTNKTDGRKFITIRVASNGRVAY